jgi:hypothetical protein
MNGLQNILSSRLLEVASRLKIVERQEHPLETMSVKSDVILQALTQFQKDTTLLNLRNHHISPFIHEVIIFILSRGVSDIRDV